MGALLRKSNVQQGTSSFSTTRKNLARYVSAFLCNSLVHFYSYGCGSVNMLGHLYSHASEIRL